MSATSTIGDSPSCAKAGGAYLIPVPELMLVPELTPVPLLIDVPLLMEVPLLVDVPLLMDVPLLVDVPLLIPALPLFPDPVLIPALPLFPGLVLIPVLPPAPWFPAPPVDPPEAPPEACAMMITLLSAANPWSPKSDAAQIDTMTYFIFMKNVSPAHNGADVWRSVSARPVLISIPSTCEAHRFLNPSSHAHAIS